MVSHSPVVLAPALICAVLAAFANAQGVVVLPSKATRAAPGALWMDRSDQSGPFHGSSLAGWMSRTQYLYDASDVPVAVANFDACSVRSEHMLLNVAGTYQTTLVVSQGPHPSSAASATFAANHGASPTTVFSGAINLPATSSSPWPTAWQPAIPFAQPVSFARAAGGSLVVEFQTAVTNSRSWYLEGYRIEGGVARQEFMQPGCRNSAGTSSSGFSWNTEELVPGGSLTLAFSGYPRNTPSLASNGLFLSPTGLGSNVLGMTTPFPLVNLGLPSPPTCAWAIDLLGDGWPMTYNAAQGQLVIYNAAIPNDPSLAAATLFVQDIAADTDPVTGAVMLFPSLAAQLTIGTGVRVPATRVASTSPTLPAVGAVKLGNAASLRLHY